MSRPPLAKQRLSLTTSGNVCYQLKSPYRDGTTHVIFESLDFIAKLAALVPSPQVHLTRFHGIFAPNSHYCSTIVNQKSNKKEPCQESRTENERRIAMTWAARLKRAFDIDIKVCYWCGGAVKVIACIEDSDVINKILNHLHVHRNNQCSYR